MIYLSSNISGDSRRAAYARNSALGMLLSPLGWRTPWAPLWACDNDVYGAWDAWLKKKTTVTPEQDWFHGGEGRRRRSGEARWLKMLDKAATHHPPIFCILPDVIGDWDATLERAYRYRHEVESRGLRVALALQNGCIWKEAGDFAPFAVCVGGTTEWKWTNIARTVAFFQNRSWVHVLRVNGERPIRLARRMGVDSADGTGLCRFFDDQLPRVLRGLNCESPQMEMF